MAALAWLLAGCANDPDPDGAATGRPAVAETINGFIGGPAGIDTGGYFTEPSDVAVYAGEGDSADDDKVFVVEADAGRSGRVQRLDADGNFELAWGADVVHPGAPGDSGTGPEICRRAEFCKPAPPGSAAGAFRMPTAVAVDDRTGSVYVMDSGNRRVQQFTSDGRFTRAWGWGVATGAARFEVCEDGCRAGRRGGDEGDSNPGQFGKVASGGIAVRPRQGDVFATDGANSRVMQFTAEGRFLRAWGIGVASGANRFELCTATAGCRAGRRGNPRWVYRGGWPRHVAVDRDGVVYATDDPAHAQIVRFDADRASDGRVEGRALLAPLRMDGHNRMGIEIDSVGNLVDARDRFGPAVVEVIRPGSPRRHGLTRGQSILDFDTYVQSVNGVGVSSTSGVIYLAKSEHLNPTDPGTSYTSCSTAGGRAEECHGLMIVTARGRPAAILDPPRRVSDREATMTGTITTTGTVSYSFQTSRAGGPWTNVTPPRYVTAADAKRVRAVARDLDPGARYDVRILLVNGPRSSTAANERPSTTSKTQVLDGDP